MALILGKRMGFEIHVVRPHNVPAVMLGCGLLFVGWFGFNGGSALAADGYAALAICNTLLAGYAASASWLVVERIVTGKPTLVGGCTGILAGLVVITPACGFVDPMIAIVMGIIVSPICYFFIAVLKRKLGWDDALDAFGCHGVGGIVGCILTGIFALPRTFLQWAWRLAVYRRPNPAHKSVPLRVGNSGVCGHYHGDYRICGQSALRRQLACWQR